MGLSIIIPSRNSENLVPCVLEARKHEPDVRIIVVDDGLDYRAAPLNGPTATFVPGQKAFIFARNINIGIHAAGDDDVVLCNDDALLRSPGGFTLLQKAAEEHPEYGIIGATCNNVGNQNQWPQNIGLREDPRMVCFVAVFIPRRTINAVGLLDERFAKYGMDDDDYSLRVRRAGLKIGIHDGCYMDHGSLTSSYRGAAGAGGDFLPNLRLFIEKWGFDNREMPRESSPWSDLFPCR